MNKKILPVFAVIVVIAVLVVAFLPLNTIGNNAVSKYFLTGEIRDPSFVVTGYNNHTWFTSSLRSYHVNNTSIVVFMNNTWGHKMDAPNNMYLLSMTNTLPYAVNLTVSTNYTHGQFFYYDINNSTASMVFEKVVRNNVSLAENFSVVDMTTLPVNIGSWLNGTNYYEINNGWVVQNGQQIHVPAKTLLTISLANYEYSFSDNINYTSSTTAITPFVSVNNTTSNYQSGVISI